MVRDLNWDISIVGHPIVREQDGLAMSSRNTYLSEDERTKALCLSNSIQAARKLVGSGNQNAGDLKKEVECTILKYGGVLIDYIAIVDAETLKECEVVDKNSVLALAVKIGRTRLIDNGFLYAEA